MALGLFPLAVSPQVA
jgi:hypothetical protein